jgi:hypothetical protein
VEIFLIFILFEVVGKFVHIESKLERKTLQWKSKKSAFHIKLFYLKKETLCWGKIIKFLQENVRFMWILMRF